MSLFEDEGAWKPSSKPPSVHRMMFNVFIAAALLAVLKYWKIVSFGPANGPPHRTASVLDMLFDPDGDGKVCVLFTNQNGRVVRSVEVGPRGTLGRFGPLAPGESGSCRVARPSANLIPCSFVVGEPTGDVRYSCQVIARHPFTDTQAITLNSDGSYSIGPGPHSRDR